MKTWTTNPTQHLSTEMRLRSIRITNIAITTSTWFGATIYNKTIEINEDKLRQSLEFEPHSMASVIPIDVQTFLDLFRF